MAWIAAGEVLARWVGDGAPDESVVAQWVDDAETLITFEYPDIQTRIDDEVLPLARVKLVVARVVIRALRNPDNARVMNIGPAGMTYAGDNPGGLQLTAEDRSMLGAAAGAPRQRAFMIDTTPVHATGEGYWLHPDVWVNTT